jgi:type IV pilus assembly protein PilX
MKPVGSMKHGERQVPQAGLALLACLVLLVVVALLGLSAARVAIEAELWSRNDHDRRVAFLAAEAALEDAQRDIEQATDERGLMFADGAQRFDAACGAGLNNPRLGLCAGPSAWLSAEFLDASATGASSVPYGHLTGSRMPVAGGMLPARLPRYIIEDFPLREAGASAEPSGRRRLFRISAIGFGRRESTRVVLQAWYRRAGDG